MTGADSLKLIVTDAGDDKGKDHADWAGARLLSTEPLTEVSETSDLILPKEFALFQNYPNPFNPTTSITFKLKQASDVQLIVFNMLGQNIITLANQTLDAGTHTVQWDGTNASGSQVVSGIYFYQIETKQYSNVKKMLLMR